MNSSNPFVGEQQFAKNAAQNQTFNRTDNVMTIQGAVNKTLILSAILVVSAYFSVVFLLPSFSMAMFWGAALGAMALAAISFFKPTVAPYTAPLYAVVEGILLGLLSAIMAGYVGDWGIVFNAILLTMLCLVTMLVAYRTGLIKPTQKFRAIITTATGAIFFVYLINMALQLFGMNIPYLHEGGVIGIGISLFIIGIASLNLILDFDNIERGAQMGAPQYMEWVSGLGLLVTLVWIYIEILRLLAIFASND